MRLGERGDAPAPQAAVGVAGRPGPLRRRGAGAPGPSTRERVTLPRAGPATKSRAAGSAPEPARDLGGERAHLLLAAVLGLGHAPRSAAAFGRSLRPVQPLPHSP